MKQDLATKYISLLNHELEPALGCTEPIAVAYASAIASKTLGHIPDKITASCSANIIKNVKSVIVPNSGGQKGIEAAAILGTLGGNPDLGLEVLTTVSENDIKKSKELVGTGYCHTEILEGVENLHIIIEMNFEKETSLVEIIYAHTNVTRIEKNGKSLLNKNTDANNPTKPDYSFMNVHDILEFANSEYASEVATILEKQLEYNSRISKEGLTNKYGLNIGQTLLDVYGDKDVHIRAKAAAAAGSDARMGGCILPVVINSGSGNQGMTVSLPILEYAKELNASHATLLHALLISNLVALHIKARIGKLSAYCGAVGAAAGASAGIAWLNGLDEKGIDMTISNTLANISGMVCDGAKASCAAKIASALEAAILGYELAKTGRAFPGGDGIIKDDIEDTIAAVGRMAHDGMKETDLEILRIMLDE